MFLCHGLTLANLPEILSRKDWFGVVWIRKQNHASTQHLKHLHYLTDSGQVSGTGEGDGYPLQFSCLENPMGRDAWKAIVHGVAKSQT